MPDKAFYSSPEGQAYTIEIAKLVSYLGMGCYFYDITLNIGFDASIIRGKRQRRWPQAAYFTARIALLIYIALLLQVLWAKKEFACQGVFWGIEFLMGIVVWTSSILLACRTVCVYSGRARDIVATILTVMALGLLAAWMQDVKAVTAAWMPEKAQLWSEGACVWLSVSRTYYVKYVCTIIFDTTVLVLTVTGILQMPGRSRLGIALIQQGILYFVLTFVANLIITVLALLQLSPTMSLLISVPQSVICTVCASRIYVQLASVARSSHQSNSASSEQSQSNGGCSYDAKGGSIPVISPMSSVRGRPRALSVAPQEQDITSKGSLASYFVPSLHREQTTTRGNDSRPFDENDEFEDIEGQTHGTYLSTREPGVLIQQERTIRSDRDEFSNDPQGCAAFAAPISHPYSLSSLQREEIQARFPKLLRRDDAEKE